MSKYNYASLENRVIINLKWLPDHLWATISEVEHLCVSPSKIIDSFRFLQVRRDSFADHVQVQSFFLNQTIELLLNVIIM